MASTKAVPFGQERKDPMQAEKTGALIRTLREEAGLSQRDLAQALQVTAQAVSKWERGLGCPDPSLLPQLSRLLGTPVEGLLSGTLETQDGKGGSMKHLLFYLCPHCGNLITSSGPAQLSCCGRTLEPLPYRAPDAGHTLRREEVEDEWLLTSPHPMDKDHYLSFCALVTGDRALVVRRWPEWDFQVRLPRREHGFLYWYCTRHGLFRQVI